MEEKGEEVVIAHGHMVDAEPVVECLKENDLVDEETRLPPIMVKHPTARSPKTRFIGSGRWVL